MRSPLVLLVVGLTLSSLSPALALSGEIAADRNPIQIGQSATLRWYFTGKKVVVSGGRFAKGAIVTGRTSLTDAPRTSTKYTFDVWYDAPASGSKTESSAGATSASAPSQPAPPAQQVPKTVELHAQYSIVVDVIDPRALGLVPYIDSRGWKVDYLKIWKRDNVAMGDPASNALMYFQQEDDSIERLAVAVLPVKEASVGALMDKILRDVPSHYEQVTIHSRSETMFEGVPAVLATFSGTDDSHPGTRTQSIVLTFVKGNLGYVVSARTQAAKYPVRQSLLQAMVKSFMFTPPRSVGSL